MDRSNQDHGYDPMWDREDSCEICLRGSDSCDCEPCPTCGQVGALDCRLHGLAVPEAIRSMRDLANAVGESRAEPDVISRRLYKVTKCGISCYFPPGAWPLTVVLSGYCEGTDAECPTYRLVAPFTEAEFWDAVNLADRDGCDLWDETHGCAHCGTGKRHHGDGCRICKEWEADGWPPLSVDHKCKHCHGVGLVR